ncbi:hypothetical protein BCAR13_940042 [Paraburkholderia caribensis]|nr:hypothetical protein BCAR13_940042 [Paraburkholderia caribensis]
MCGLYRRRCRRCVQHDRRDRRDDRSARRPVFLPAARSALATTDGRGAQVHRRQPERGRLQRQHGRLAGARQGIPLQVGQLSGGRFSFSSPGLVGRDSSRRAPCSLHRARFLLFSRQSTRCRHRSKPVFWPMPSGLAQMCN